MPLYFAYGSNMEGHQIVIRCPSATYVNTATLGGYIITFPLTPRPFILFLLISYLNSFSCELEG